MLQRKMTILLNNLPVDLQQSNVLMHFTIVGLGALLQCIRCFLDALLFFQFLEAMFSIVP
uniref:Uncharacterized protein n=1 Tax=Anopheles atroparvus TaxID=41427 RepID=A0AAG5CQJ6_ANOAO